MKIQCDVCEKAEAAVLCCADEAALCWTCDKKVHAANKLAEKHQRVPLLSRSHNSNSTSSQQHPIPRCDICQEKPGYFFCLEDRALLCRQCDVSIHSSSSSSTTPHVSSHQRFLLTGVRLDTNNYGVNTNNYGINNNTQHGAQQNNSTSTNAAAASSPNPTTIDVNINKHRWDNFSTAATNDHLGVQQPQWPTDDQFFNNNTTDCFDHYYEFSPSEFGSSRSISSSQ